MNHQYSAKFYLGHKHQISPDIYDVQAMVRDENKIRLLRTTA